MTVLLQRPTLLDAFGVEHRYGCEMTGSKLEFGMASDFMIRRCADCGATRIVKKH